MDMESKLSERYHVISALGEGGAGAVYLAKDRHLPRFVAVKTASRNDPEAIDALANERDILCRMHHAGIPQIYDYIEGKDSCFLVQELVEGKSLEQISVTGEYSEWDLCNWLLQLCDILTYLQEECSPPMIHGDIKPSNLILDKNGKLHLIDFGFSGNPGDYCSRGTTGYAAPEQYVAQGGRFTIYSDIYGAGATFTSLSRKMDTGYCFRAILHKCMNFVPEKRWKSVKTMKKTLKLCMIIHAKKV